MRVRRWTGVAVGVAMSICGAVQPASGQECVGPGYRHASFRTLAMVFSDAEPIVGVGPISPAQTVDMAHYRIRSDACGRVVEVEYRLNDASKPIHENYTANRLVPTARVTIDRDPSGFEVQFWDHLQERVVPFGTVWTVRAETDGAGRLIRTEYRDAQGALTVGDQGYALATWSWEANRVATETHYGADGTPVNSGSDFPFTAARVRFDEIGFLDSLRPSYNTSVVRLVRNEDKSLRHWSTTDTDDRSQPGGTPGVASGEYSYAPGGYLIKLRYLDEDGQSTISDRGHRGFRRVYSERGNRLEFFFIDERENRWEPPARGYAGQVFTWSADGRVRIRADRVGAGREIMDDPRSGYATVLYEFDEALRLVGETYYLADGSLYVGQ